MKTVGSNIRRFRDLAGLDQFVLAEKVFGSTTRQSDVSKHENGVHLPSTRVLMDYARVLNCSINDLLDVAYNNKLEQPAPTLEKTT